MSKALSKHGAALSAGCAIVTMAAAILLAPRPAAAQFVCGGSATGAEPQGGAGAGLAPPRRSSSAPAALTAARG